MVNDNRVFTYRDTFDILFLGLLIIIVSFVGSFFFSGVAAFVGLCLVSFGDRVKNLSKKMVEIDRRNKEVNDEGKK